MTRSPDDDRTPLAALLRQAAGELAEAQPPAWTWPAGAPRPTPAPATTRPRIARWLAGPAPSWRWAGAACALLLGVSVLLMLQPPPAAPAVVASDFVPVVPAERWPDGVDAAWIVRTEWPAERLAMLGLPYDPAHAARPVPTELLMRPSGELLAVRVLR